MHDFKFLRSGGFDQVRLDTGADLASLAALDQKLWVALACPTTGVEFDARSLELIDTDGDKRIRPNELLAAIDWAKRVFTNLDELTQRAASLPLSSLHEGTPEGRSVKASARRILANLGKPEATAITFEETTDTVRIFAQTRLNGDGIVPVDATDEAPVCAVLTDILATIGGDTDRSGVQGVAQTHLDAFVAELQAFAAWTSQGEADPAVRPLGAATEDAASALEAVMEKVDDYFTRCALAAFDGRATEHLARSADEWRAIAGRSLTPSDTEVRQFPLAQVLGGAALPFVAGVNPAWTEAIGALRARVVAPLLGDRASLTAAEWADLKQRFSAHRAWVAAKAGGRVAVLGIVRVREVLDSDLVGRVQALIDEDERQRPEAEAIASVDRAVRYYRDLVCLLENFVSFRDFYERGRKAIFQAGTLYLDGRACALTLRVDDIARHATLASLSQMYLAYCECVRKATGEKLTIVAAFTDGDADFLVAGRNGVFYDRKGVDWDATIVKVVENPISLRQAFWSPYKRIAKLISSQIEKFASSRDKDVQEQAAVRVAAPDGKKPGAFDVARFAGIFAADEFCPLVADGDAKNQQ